MFHKKLHKIWIHFRRQGTEEQRHTFHALAHDMIAPMVSREIKAKTRPLIQKLSFENCPLRMYRSTSRSSSINNRRPAHEDASDILV